MHSIPPRNVRGVLVGYRVAWDEDHFSSDDVNDSGGHADVGLDTTNYNVTSLHEYWLYNIRVAGRTSVGHGTFTTVTVRTGEDGKSFTTFSERNANPIHPFENCIIFLEFFSRTIYLILLQHLTIGQWLRVRNVEFSNLDRLKPMHFTVAFYSSVCSTVSRTTPHG